MQRDLMIDKSFPRSARLLTQDDYQHVFSHATRYTDKHITILARDNEGLGGRLGLAVSKKYARRAVDRSRLKRLIRESFRMYKQDYLSRLDLVVMVRTAAVSAKNLQIRQSLEAGWKVIARQPKGS